MLFNSLQFLIFFPLVLVLYHLLGHRAQNRMLLVASYTFYGMWDWRFLFLMTASLIVDFCCGLGISRSTNERARKLLLTLSVVVNGGALLFFKYFNFFVGSAFGFLEWIGLPASFEVLQIVLPVGISFYTFQTMCYTIDVYRGKQEPVHSFADYALYISYFPQLVAGPIERATNLMPQILNPRKVTPEGCFEGAYLILWGFFKKVVVADNLCRVADWGFGNIGELNVVSALITIYAFAWQIYCDFSGYTDIARGCSKFLGIELMLNFNVPYLSRTPSEFWRRWHISLSSWFTDYVFVPLGGSRGSSWTIYRNIFLTMLLSGLWHGAAWTFVAWGAFHAALLSVYRLIGNERINRIPAVIQTVLLFHLVCIGWILFRSTSLSEAVLFLEAFTNWSAFSLPPKAYLLALIVPLAFVELMQYVRKEEFPVFQWPAPIRVACYVTAYLTIMVIGRWDATAFIYFQF
jgi:D-alanyl-lipoteichoic acid acyltransferase DltB (MBOAT superfamily)